MESSCLVLEKLLERGSLGKGKHDQNIEWLRKICTSRKAWSFKPCIYNEIPWKYDEIWIDAGCILSTNLACCPSPSEIGYSSGRVWLCAWPNGHQLAFWTLSTRCCRCNAVEWCLVEGIFLGVVDPDQSLQQQPAVRGWFRSTRI